MELDLRSEDTSEGLLSENGKDASSNIQITITPQRWNVPHKIYVLGVDDDIVDGDQYYEISVTPVSKDAAYALAGTFVSIVNYDDDFANIVVEPSSGINGNLDTSESDEQTGQHSWTFDVTLTAQPLFPVIINIESTDTTEGEVSRTQLVFPSAMGWDKKETIQVSGVDDYLADGAQPFEVVLTIQSFDYDYAALILEPFKSTNLYVDVWTRRCANGVSTSGKG